MHTSLFCQLSTFTFQLTYDQHILQILIEAGERGLSVRAISQHVFNRTRTFFYSPDFLEIRSYVQKFLLKNSKSKQSLIESTGQRGYYRLNTNGSQDARQLMLQFSE